MCIEWNIKADFPVLGILLILLGDYYPPTGRLYCSSFFVPIYVCYFTYFSQYTELKCKQKMVTKLQHNVAKWLMTVCWLDYWKIQMVL